MLDISQGLKVGTCLGIVRHFAMRYMSVVQVGRGVGLVVSNLASFRYTLKIQVQILLVSKIFSKKRQK